MDETKVTEQSKPELPEEEKKKVLLEIEGLEITNPEEVIITTEETPKPVVKKPAKKSSKKKTEDGASDEDSQMELEF
jgi:hypothetical protein